MSAVGLPVIHVVSTGWAHPTKGLCLSSVRSQVDVEVHHTYIDADQQVPARTKMENLVEQLAKLADEAVVVLLDGDDWLAHRRALARVAQAHYGEGAWCTYGSFRNSDGSRGFAEPYGPGEDYRTTPWRATHLKSFRAGLFNRIKHEDLQYLGKWIDRGDDPAFMWPILEMAGRDRTQWLRDMLYVYNEAQGWHRSASQAELAHQAAIVGHCRGLPRYKRLRGWDDAVAYDGAHVAPGGMMAPVLR